METIINAGIQLDAEESVVTTSNSDPNRRSADNMTDDSDSETTKQKAEQDIQNVKREMGAMAREKAQEGQHRIAVEADALSDAIDAAAENLDDHDREGLARYARKLSGHIANAAEQLEGRSVDELAKDAKQLARNNPALFMLGSVAVGFGLSRFFKASAEHERDDDNAEHTDSYRNNDSLNGRPMQQRRNDTYGTQTAPHNGDGRSIP